MTDTTPSAVPTWAAWLGYAGLLPFVAGAGWVLVAAPDQRGEATRILLAYGATITSFLGAIHWGLAMRSAQDRASGGNYIWGVVPSLVAWCALLAGAAIGLPLLVVLLWVCYAVDRRRYPTHGVGHWLPMRLRLTLVASLSCLVAAVTVLAA